MSEVRNLVAAGETYKDREGNEKTSWDQVGKVFIKDDGKISVYLFLTQKWYQSFEYRGKDEKPKF